MNFLFTLLLTSLAAADNDKLAASGNLTSEVTAHNDENVHALHDSVEALHSDMHDLMTDGLKAPKKKLGLLTHKSTVKKFMTAVEMMVSLHKAFSPVMQKLTHAMDNMPDGAAKEHAGALVAHITAIDTQSLKLGALLQSLNAAKDGSKEAKDAAVKKLMVGMKGCADVIKDHMHALRELKAKYPKHDHGSAKNKLEQLLVAMEANLKMELTDPELKTNPKKEKKAKLEAVMFVLVKHAVDEQKALFAAAAKAYKDDPTSTTKEAVLVVLKKKMGELTATLKKNMMVVELALAKLEEGEDAEASVHEGSDHFSSQQKEKSHKKAATGEDDKEGDMEADTEDKQSGSVEADMEDKQSASVEADTEDKQSASVEADTEDKQSASVEADMEDKQSASMEADTEDIQSASMEADTEDKQSASMEADTEDNQSASTETSERHHKKMEDDTAHAAEDSDEADEQRDDEKEDTAHGATQEDINGALGAVDAALPDAHSQVPSAFSQLRAVEEKPASNAGDKQLK